ncbi:MAG TPA: Uma2 family endonuclease [Candidatus Baltobacteraceae bacterium]|nr:Uma2 family endonuclease [Candidatus Baltobacteraceae bacterium]
MREMARGIDTKPHLEWLDGVESVAVRPNTPHGVAAMQMLKLLDRQGGEFGQAMPELHVRLSDNTVLLPDVAFYRNDALLSVPRDERLIPAIPAEVLVEVRSPNDRPGFREEKIRRYLAWGTPLVFDVDPPARTIVVHTVAGVRRLTQDDTFADPLVPWLTFDVSEVFDRLDRLGL